MHRYTLKWSRTCIETKFGKAQLSDIGKRILVVDIWSTAAKKRHNWDALTFFRYPNPNTMTLTLCTVAITLGTRCARDSWLIGIGLPLNFANLGTFFLVLRLCSRTMICKGTTSPYQAILKHMYPREKASYTRNRALHSFL